MGPFITAYVKVNGGSDAARRQAAEWLAPLKDHLADGGLGHISEILDGDAPQRPCGCMAQAWSVAEILRALVEDVHGLRPMAQRQVPAAQARAGAPAPRQLQYRDRTARGPEPIRKRRSAVLCCARALRRYCEESTSHAAVAPVFPRSADLPRSRLPDL